MSCHTLAKRQPPLSPPRPTHQWPWLPVLVAAAGLIALMLAAPFPVQ